MASVTFSPAAIPPFAGAPSVILVVGDVEFFVEEAAATAVEKLAEKDAEVLRFDDDTAAEAVSDALLNRSLFSPRRVVQFDISALLGTETPGKLLVQAVEAWEKNTPAGKREAHRHARALLSALDLSSTGAPEELAGTVARKVKKKELAEPLAEILSEMPEERGGWAVLAGSLRLMLERGNDGTVAVLTATAPPSGVDLLAEIEEKGLLVDASIGEKKDIAPALAQLARALAKQREVAIDSDAIERLRVLTDERPALFAAEIEKLIEWAGPGGRIRAADVRDNVEDEASEDVYALYEAIGRRDAGDALGRLERLFSGRAVRAGERPIDIENYWPPRLLGMLADEVRRMLLIRARLEEAGRDFDASMSYPTFQARMIPLLCEPVVPFGASPFATARGQVPSYALFKAAQRASRFTTRELAAGLARAANVDVKLKSSAEPLETFSVYVGELIAGELKKDD